MRLKRGAVLSPGLMLKKAYSARGMTQRALIEALGRPAPTVSNIVNDKKRITAHTALDFERVLGIPALEWLIAQAKWDLYKAQIERTWTEPEQNDEQKASGQ